MKKKGKTHMSVDDIMVDAGHAKYNSDETIDIVYSTFKGNFRGEMELIEVYMMTEDNSKCPSCGEENTKSASMITNLGKIFACKSCKLFTLDRLEEEQYIKEQNKNLIKMEEE